MIQTTCPIWQFGRDDELIRRHLGTTDLSALHNPMNWLRNPMATFEPHLPPSARRHAPNPSPHRKPFEFQPKYAVKAWKFGLKMKKIEKLTWQFGIGQDGGWARYSKNMRKGGRFWQWRSLKFEGNGKFRGALRPKLKDGKQLLRMNRQTYKAGSPEARKLLVGVSIFDAKGLWKGAKNDFRFALAEIGVTAVWKVWEGFSTERGWQPLREYISDPMRLWDLAKAVIKGAIAGVVVAGIVTVATAATTIAIIPIAVGLVATVAVGCIVDAAFGDECIVETARRWLTEPSPDSSVLDSTPVPQLRSPDVL